MRKRLIAVAAVALLIAGAWFGNIFRGFGPGGPGSGEGAAEAPPADTQVNLGTEQSILLTTPTSAASGEAAPTAPKNDQVLTVLVAKDRYEVQSGDDATATFEPYTLESLVEQAKTRTGDEHGVRVRLRFKRDAQEGATSDLVKALQAAGIPREQIIESTGYVE
ncbi:MAG: hypothetical protein U0992_15010 [Planctomycetaceae bacterium]